MRTKAVFAALSVLASVALAAWLVGPGLAENDERNGGVIRAGDVEIGNGVVRAGNAVIDDAGARIENGPSDDSGNGTDEDDLDGTTVAEGEVVLKFRGDEGVEFSGKCSTGGEEQEMDGTVPDEFTFKLDGDELECEVRKEGDGRMKMILLSGNSRSVQGVTGDSTMKLTFSENGVSSSMTSGSGSSSVVSQSSSSSSIVQSVSSSTSD